jgi:DNA-binding transcriptional MerR regulator
VQVVKGIKEIQELGFTLKEIKELLDLHHIAACLANKPGAPRGVQRMIILTKEKLQNIEKKIELLRKMQKDVARMLENLRTEAARACPVARQMPHTPAAAKR